MIDANELTEKEIHQAVNEEGKVLVVESKIYKELFIPNPHHFLLFYRGGEFMHVAAFENSDGDPTNLGVEIYDGLATGKKPSFSECVSNENLRKWIRPPEETPVENRIDWDAVEYFSDE